MIILQIILGLFALVVIFFFGLAVRTLIFKEKEIGKKEDKPSVKIFEIIFTLLVGAIAFYFFMLIFNK